MKPPTARNGHFRYRHPMCCNARFPEHGMCYECRGEGFRLNADGRPIFCVPCHGTGWLIPSLGISRYQHWLGINGRSISGA